MSSLTAWNNFLKEGYEVLGDDFEDLTEYEQVRASFSSLTGEILPLLTVESGLYSFVNGSTLKSWREKHVQDDSQMLGAGLDRTTIDILESDAMIMKDDREKYARFLHGYVLDAIQEEAVKFEDTLFEEQGKPEQEEPQKEDTFRSDFYSLLSKVQEKYPKATRISMLEHCSDKLDIPFNTVASTTSRCNIGKYMRQKAQILDEMKLMLQGRKENKTDGPDSLQVELAALRDEWYSLTGKVRGFYSEVARLLQCRQSTICLLTSPSKANKRMGTKKDAIGVVKKMISALKGQEKQNTNKENKATMKPQERTTQEPINILAKNLVKSVLNQLNVNDLNAEIADAFTKVTNLKAELASAEAQMETYKTVKDMLSKDELTEADILVLTSYVDSVSGN